MQVELVEIIFDDQKSYKFKPLVYCCEDLQRCENIVITNRDIEESFCPGFQEEEDIPCVCLTRDEVVYSYEDDFTTTYNTPIHYCPFCGEKIEVKVCERLDKSELFSNIREKYMPEAYRRSTRTDSIKKADQYQKIYTKWQRRMNSFFGVTEFLPEIFEED